MFGSEVMSSASFYGSRRSLPSSSSRSLPQKRKRLNAASVGDAVSMGEAIRMSHGINTVTDKDSSGEKGPEGVLDDLSDLSDVESDYEGEFDRRSPNNDSESEFLNNSGNMYSFEHVTSLHTSTPLSTRSHSSASNISGSGSSVSGNCGSTSLVDLIQRQNQLIMELLSKQDSMTSAIEEVRHDLKETRSHVDQLMEVQKSKIVDTDCKSHKRKYPSSLTV